MTTSDWQRLEQAFEQALQLEGAEREAFLTMFSKEYPRLADKLADLLAADGQRNEALEAPIRAAADSLAETTDDVWVGRTLGVWQIEKRIAAGGMGAVFLAQRADSEYTQHAALKIMTGQLLAPDAISRFRAERQILASLQHPNIASLIDGGSTEEQLPYIVMEYIDGQPIDAYCDAQQLDLRDRLRLFQRVCDALDYAHRNLVVHRDIKPSNILVDAAGAPKLLDFGIAKLLDAGSYDLTQALTRADARAMTLSYASPEHVLGQPVSIASDVYSLGVLLYRLLTGQSPYRQTLDSQRSIESAILETDPERPSAAVTREGANTTPSPARLQRLMTGDLDNIVLKALQKDPQRRYATAAAFRDDIDRFLTDRPVSARPDSLAYRAGKFIRRNTLALATAAVFSLTVITLVVFYTRQLTVERDAAQLQAARSDEIAGFMNSLFANATPDNAKGEAVTAVELLDEGFERIDALDVQPELRAELMSNMANNMMELGQQQRAIPMMNRAREILEREPEQNGRALWLLYSRIAEAHRQVEELDKSMIYQQHTIDAAVALFGPDHRHVAFQMMRMGNTLFDMDRVDEALELEARAIAMFDALGLRESSQAIDARGNYANALQYVGRLVEAEAVYREVVTLSERVDGELATNTLIRIANLSGLLTRIGRLREAESHIDTALERGARVWPENYDIFSQFFSYKCTIRNRLGDFTAALSACERALEVAQINFGEESKLYARRMRTLASQHGDLGDFETAAARYDLAETATAASAGADSGTMRTGYLSRSKVPLAAGDYDEAERLLRAVLREPVELSGSADLYARERLATVLSKTGRLDEATRLFKAVIADAEALVGDGPAMLPTLAVATAHFRKSGDLDQALMLGERARRIIDGGDESLTWRGALALGEYGLVLRAQGDERANAVLDAARSVLVPVFGDGDLRVLALKP